MFPVAEDAEPLKLLALDVDEFARKRFGFFADFQRRKPAGFFDNFVFDGQSVTIPAGDKRRAFAKHGLRFDHEILEDLVECCAHVDVAIGKGRPIMKNKQFSTLSRFLNLPVKACLLPRPEHLRFARGKVRLHREIRPRQIESIFVVLAHRRHATLTSVNW